MAKKNVDTEKKMLSVEDVRQPRADVAPPPTRSEIEPINRKRAVAASQQSSAEKAGQQTVPSGTTRENLKVKKEMARAMLEMGIAKKDVMEILNVVIK